MIKDINKLLEAEIKEKSNLGYSHFANVIHNFKEYEHYKETKENKYYNNQRYYVYTGVMWDDDAEGRIRIIINVKKPKFLLFSTKVTGYFLIDNESKITSTYKAVKSFATLTGTEPSR